MPDFICSSCGTAFEAESDARNGVVCPFCGAAAQSPAAEQLLPPGTRVDGYEILRHIAAGGSGQVYLAKQLSMGRSVALKILNPGFLDKERAERFLEEARNTAKFENPHVVTVIDAGISDEGLYFIAMQYVAGRTLEEILMRGHVFSEEEALSIVLTVAEALRKVWDKFKMFHRDIKPANIMLTPEKEAMVLDMGLAQERGSSVLADGNIEGSPYYMSPEQARGEELTWSSDLYSLGATLYQMVAGAYPYDGPSVEVIMRRHDQAPFPDPCKKVPGLRLSARTVKLLRRMMAKKPEDRFASWGDFIGEVRDLLAELRLKNGSMIPDARQQQMLTSSEPDIKKEPDNGIPRPFRFAFFGCLVFLLAMAVLGGTCLYLAAQKNSGAAYTRLESFRELTAERPMDVSAAEKFVRDNARYFQLFGVPGKIRNEYRKLVLQISQYKQQNNREENLLGELESETAKALLQLDSELREFKKTVRLPSAEWQQPLSGILKKVQDAVLELPQNRQRKEMLLTRLQSAEKDFQKGLGEIQQKLLSVQREKALKQKRAEEAARAAAVRKNAEIKQRNAKQLADYEKILRQEQDRIRILLLLQDPKDKFSRQNELLYGSFPKRKSLPLLKNANARYDQWLAKLQQWTIRAAVLWDRIYDSRKTFSGYVITAPQTNNTPMLTGTIIRDRFHLHYEAMQNVTIPFAELPEAEWLKFLRHAAGNGQLAEVESFLLLTGHFQALGATSDIEIQREIPLMRHAFFRFLAGEPVPGIDSKLRPPPHWILRRYENDPEFEPYRKKMQHTETLSKSKKGKS